MTARVHDHHAFMPRGRFEVHYADTGGLRGLTFAAKDVFDVAGYPTGAGDPTRAQQTGPAAHHAAVVDLLLEAGATLIGKTATDELAYGIMGTYPHVGDPVNPVAPDRKTGGSSSGSASAVAAAVCLADARRVGRAEPGQPRGGRPRGSTQRPRR